MFFKIKYHFIIISLFLLLFLSSCQLQEPQKNHGILFLENRSNQLNVDNTNKNDVLKIIGYPHSRSVDSEDTWIYIERSLSKGKYHKLGKNIVKDNNVLVLSFDKYGVLKKKDFYNKDDIKNITFSSENTDSQLTKKSFVENFLSSVKEKMYGNRK
tara:strand:+ start:10373 stop:10840 length:468 start_codon:yes stop_codon:yes gene_type:complete